MHLILCNKHWFWSYYIKWRKIDFIKVTVDVDIFNVFYNLILIIYLYTYFIPRQKIKIERFQLVTVSYKGAVDLFVWHTKPKYIKDIDIGLDF